MSPLFRFAKLKDVVTPLNEKAKDIVKNIGEKGNNSTIDVLPILKMGILKAFCGKLFSLVMIYSFLIINSALEKNLQK